MIYQLILLSRYLAGTMELVLIAFLLPQLDAQWKISTEESSALASAVFVGTLLGSVSKYISGSAYKVLDLLGTSL
jgi:hypothetical protein